MVQWLSFEEPEVSSLNSDGKVLTTYFRNIDNIFKNNETMLTISEIVKLSTLHNCQQSYLKKLS